MILFNNFSSEVIVERCIIWIENTPLQIDLAFNIVFLVHFCVRVCVSCTFSFIFARNTFFEFQDRFQILLYIFFHFWKFLAADDKVFFFVTIYSIVDFFTIPPSFLTIYLNRYWLGMNLLNLFFLFLEFGVDFLFYIPIKFHVLFFWWCISHFHLSYFLQVFDF